ncbi:MAG: hypothetical protein RDV48_29855 [Candidatus Eremiobacteraeota bacterium]|nr:hypothetical protein [Candidatus Eremiobacteraeota bacterium]
MVSHIVTISQEELEELENIDVGGGRRKEEQPVTREELKSLLEEVMESRSMQLMKPVEQQALFIAGRLSQENRELHERIEAIREENVALRDKLKCLPAPAEEVTQVMKVREREVQSLREEKAALEAALSAEKGSTEKTSQDIAELRAALDEEATKKTALISDLELRLAEEKERLRSIKAREEMLADKARQGDALVVELEERIKEVFLEEGRVRAELKAQWEKSIMQLREKLREEEEAKARLRDEWHHAATQLQEMKRPWWKKVAGLRIF